jgi:nitrous oxidase accessory protein NosD
MSQGDTIEVQNGTYYENINIVKKIVLRGMHHPVVNAQDNGSAITLSSNGIVVDGLIITNSSASGSGINVSNHSRDNVIKGNIVGRNRGNGIDLWASKIIAY